MARTRVIFYRLNAPDRVEGIARLLLRRGRLTPRVAIYAPDEETLTRLDTRLWTVHPESFLAHGIARADDPDWNARQPILLVRDPALANDVPVLIHAGLEIPPLADRFETVVDFVDAWDEQLLAASRERFRAYRLLGLSPSYHANDSVG